MNLFYIYNRANLVTCEYFQHRNIVVRGAIFVVQLDNKQ